MAVLIEPATLATASFVCANLRQADVDEAFCQLPAGTKRHEFAYAMLMSGDNYVATLHGQPVGFFGTSPMNAVCSSVWAIGTNRFERAVPAITRFFHGRILPLQLSMGVTSAEARSLASHTAAHRWIYLTGGVAHGPEFCYGRNGEKFVLFRWTEASISARTSKRRSS